MISSPLNIELTNDGRILRLALARPKANIVDAEMIATLHTALSDHKDQSDLVAVLITAEGHNFSFGASVEEHLPDQRDAMLKALHGLILDVVDYPVPILVAVRGFCLGGGMEVACAGNLMFVAPDVQFGQPEIQLAVFAPVASCLLPEKIGQAQAEDLLFSGRSIDAEEALRLGLVNAIHDDPEQAAVDYIEKQLLPQSTSTLRHAVWAARVNFVERVREKIVRVEKCYLEDLMSGNDPQEGLQFFLEKRKPEWKNS